MSEFSASMLDELQSCNYDTTDCSETPSPTLSQTSAASDGTTLTSTAASSHVIILPLFSSILFNRAVKVEKKLVFGLLPHLINWHVGSILSCKDFELYPCNKEYGGRNIIPIFKNGNFYNISEIKEQLFLYLIN